MDEDPTLRFDPSDAQAQVPETRRVWGGFSLLARVGSGGYGEVYRAWDSHLQREVALKLLLPGVGAEDAQGDAEYASMLHEARALAAVQHPNVVHVYGIDRHDGRVGFWTDFVRGKTLSALLSEQGPFGCREAALIATDVTRALSAVHRAGILHRDIKAENVMREEGGRILLMDFGLSSLPQAQMILAGTPSYMAPELFHGSSASVATDIYAMGVLLYYLVTGTFPVKLTGYTPAEVDAAFRRRRPLMDLRPDLPESFLRTVSIAMEIDPAKRFASAGQLAESLAETLGTPVVRVTAVTPVAAVPAVTEEPRRRERKRTWRTWVILAIVGLSIWGGRAMRWARGKITGESGTSAAAASGYSRYLKAQELLSKSYQNANTAKAVTEFQAILAGDGNFALAQAGLGSAYFIQYRGNQDPKLLELSQTATNRAIQLDPSVAPPYVTLARIAAMEGDTAVAMQYAQKAMSLDPHSADAYRALAEVYDAQGRRKDAIAAMQKAEDLAPEDWRWPLNLGNYYFAAGKLDEAEQSYERSAELAPDNAVAYYNMGMVKWQADQLDAAKVDFEHSLKIEDEANVEQMLGELLGAQGKYADAITAQRKAAALSPNDYSIWGDLGEAYYMAGDHTRSMAAYRRAIDAAETARKKEPKNTRLLVLLANDEAVVGDASRSKVLLREALALSPDDPDVNYRAGATYELLQQREQAMELIAKALGHGYHAAEFQRDPLLAGLRADPQWAEVLRRAKTQSGVDTRAKMN